MVRSIKLLLAAIAACGVSLIGLSPCNAASTFFGKLWLVPIGQAVAQFPAPSSAPDVTFSTAAISFFSGAPNPPVPTGGNWNNNVGGLLASGHKLINVIYSGNYNSAVGSAVGPNTKSINTTPKTCGTYGSVIEITGLAYLVNTGEFYVAADDQVALKIDGKLLYYEWGDPSNFIFRFHYYGQTGLHSIDLLWSNACGGSYLSFSPAM